MIQIISKKKGSTWLDNNQVQILSDALLHEMERYNKASALVADEHANGAIEEAKDKVYEVFSKVVKFIEDPEID